MKHLSSIIRASLLAPILAASAWLAASAQSGAGLQEGRLEVVLSEWSLGFKAAEADAETLPIHAVNRGTVRHNLTVRERGATSEIYKTRLLEPGETADLSLEFSKGRYDLYCSVPGHRERGMLASLAVGEAPPREAPRPRRGGGGYY